MAGATLAHFGAFLDRSFRTNDIMWGRLRTHRTEQLIDEAQMIIIREYLKQRKDELGGVVCVAKSLQPPVSDQDAQAKAIRESASSTLTALPQQLFKQAVEGFLTPERIRAYLQALPPPREPDRRTTLECITRSINIVGFRKLFAMLIWFAIVMVVGGTLSTRQQGSQ